MFTLEGFSQQNDYLKPHYQEYDNTQMTYGDIIPFYSNEVTSDFGPRRKPSYDWHSGIDFACSSCKDNLSLSCQSGWFYYGETSSGLRHVIINGNSDLAYLHLFSTLKAGKCEILGMKGKPNQKVVLIDHNGTILAWSAVTGQVNYNGMDHDVENYIEAGQPLGAIGGSGGFQVHLHIEELPDGSKSISSDNISKNPLQTLHYDIPDYSEIKLFYSPTNSLTNVSEGLKIKYPGTKINSVLIRPNYPNGINNGLKFNTVNDVNTVSLFLRNTSLSGNWELVSGPNFRSEFKYGGNLGQSSYPEKIKISSGSFNSTGIYPDAYSESQPHEYDNFLFCDFFHRIHNDDQMKGNKSMLTANCPEDSRYSDGNYEFKSTLQSVGGTIIEGSVYSTNLDNFQPYIQSVNVLIDGTEVYSAFWDCGTDGPEFSGYECHKADVKSTSIIIINVTTSEPITNLKGRIVEFPQGFLPYNQVDALHWTLTVQNLNYLKEGDIAHLEFTGLDFNGNKLLDLKAMAGGKIISRMPVKIPIRESNTVWKPARKGGDVDQVHEFCFKNCNEFKNDDVSNGFQSPDCISSSDLDLSFEMESFNGAGDAWIHLEIINGVPPYFIRWTDPSGNTLKQGFNEFDLTDLTAGTYCYSIQDDYCCEIHSCVTICPSINVTAQIGLTHPSECQLNDGNIRIIHADARGGRAPYDYHLEDIHGNRIPLDPNTGKYEELSAGKYLFIATDQNGCTGFYTIELISPEDFLIIPTITHACDGDNGLIYAEAFTGFYPDDKYNFSWSTGFEENNVTESLINQLAAGKYCVTVTSNTTLCSKEECFKIKGSGKQLTMKHVLRIPCPNKNNGEIQITVNGGNKPYLYNWTHGDYRPKTTHLEAKKYCVTVTDDCFNTITQCFDLSTVISVNLKMEYRCPYNVNVYSTSTGGNPPYSFNWSNGGNTKDLIEVPIGVIYKVTVTDKFGCTAVSDINTNPIELLNPVKPCKGFWDGEMTIKINNPNNERVNVSYDYRPCDDCTPLYKIYNDFSNPIIFTLKELAGNKEYHLNVRIGDCFFEIKFELGEDELQEEFKRYEENNGLASCIYDLVCKDNRIVDGKRTGADLKQVGGNCKKFIFKECASTEVRCAGHPDIIKTIPGQKVHMRRLELIMYAQRLGLDASSLSGNFCDHVWICQEDPFCIVATARGELGGRFRGIEKNGDCYKVKCRSFFGLINQDYYICGEGFIPEDFLPFYRNDRNYEGAGGKPKATDCTPMTLNFTDVLECWPKFVLEDGNKFYESEMAKLVDSYRNRRERYCAWITFCLEDFSIVKTNINDFECEDFHPPINFGNWLVSSTCDPHYFEGNDIVFCECNDPEIIAKNGICLEPKILPRKCTLALKANEEPKAIQILPFQNGNTHFTNFSSFYQPEGFTTINGIYEDDFGSSYYQKYEPGELYHKLEEFDGALFVHKNAKLDKINLITKGNSPNSFEIYSGNYNAIDFNSITSSNELEFISFYAFENGFTAIGEFNGQLYFDTDVLSNSNTNSIFILYRNDIENVTEISILTGVNLLNSNNKNTNSYLFKRKSNQHAILFNGSELEMDENMNTILMKVNSNGAIDINSFAEIPESINIIEFQESADGLEKYILGVAKGNIEIEDQIINLPVQEQIILMKWIENELEWYRNFDQVGIDIQSISMEYMTGHGIALGLNVRNTCMLFKTDPVFQNSIGNDIVILNYDFAGNLNYNQRFGSNSDDEVLKDLYFTEENVLYIGGEIKGSSAVRSIGDLDLIKASNVDNSAFISYINFNTTIPNAELRTQQKEVEAHSKISILSLTPNPVNERLVIEFEYVGSEKCYLEVYDLTGKLISVLNNQLSDHILMNTSKLNSGIYFIRLIDGIGNYDMKRFIKL